MASSKSKHVAMFFMNMTFKGPCIVIYSYNTINEMH